MIKKIALIFAFILSLTSLPACSPKSNNTDAKILTIYVDPYSHTLYQAIDYFNQTGSAFIEREEGKQADNKSDFENFKSKFTTEIMSGNGPDIIVARPDFFSSIHKAAASGAFYDLNKLIAADKQFNLSDYNNIVMDSGVFDGKRYFMPIDYTFQTLSTTRDILKANGIAFNNIKTLKDFSEKAKEFTTLHNKSSKYFIYGNNPIFIIPQIIKNSGLNFIDYKTKTVKFNTDEFKNLLSMCKYIYESIAPREAMKYYWYEALSKRMTVMTSDMWDFNWYRNVENNDVQMYIIPSFKGGNHVFMETWHFIAINSKCKYKNEAFKFVKLFLSEKFQHVSRDIPKCEIIVPVNKKAYIEDSNFIIYNLDGSSTDKYDQIKAVKDNDERNRLTRKAVEDQYNQMQKNAVSVMHDNEITNIIWEEAESYFKGKKTVSEVVETMENKVLLLLNE